MATYYVSKTGNDANDGLTINTAKQTITAGIALIDNVGLTIRPDTLYIRGGTYDESFTSTWIHNGGANSYDLAKTIAAYPNNSGGVEPVIIKPSSGVHIFNFSYSSQIYIILRGLILDGGGGISSDVMNLGDFQSAEGGTHPSGFVTLDRCEIRNGPVSGVNFADNLASGAFPNRAVNCWSHNNGTSVSLHHGFYVSSAGNTIEHCQVNDNAAYGIHNFIQSQTRASKNIIRYNTIYNQKNYGILVGSGSDNQVYYNLVYHNNGGIRCDFGPGNGNIIQNNTIYFNKNGVGTGSGILVGNADGAMTHTILRNNIIAANASNLTDNGTNTLQINNRQTAGNDGMDGNFWLTTATPLADRQGGADLGYTQDIIGTPVPQGPHPSLGAFEWVPPRTVTLSVNAVGDGSGSKNSLLSNLQGPSSYTTGGFRVDAVQLGLTWIDYAHASATAYLGASTSKEKEGKFPSQFIRVLVYQPNGGSQVPAGTNLSNRYFKIWALGK